MCYSMCLAKGEYVHCCLLLKDSNILLTGNNAMLFQQGQNGKVTVLRAAAVYITNFHKLWISHGYQDSDITVLSG